MKVAVTYTPTNKIKISISQYSLTAAMACRCDAMSGQLALSCRNFHYYESHLIELQHTDF